MIIICNTVVMISGCNTALPRYVQDVPVAKEDLSRLADPRALTRNSLAGIAQPFITVSRIQNAILPNETFAKETFNTNENPVVFNVFMEVEQTLAAEEWRRKQTLASHKASAQIEASQKLAVFSYGNGIIQILLDSDHAPSANLSIKRHLLSNRINLYLVLVDSV